MTRSHVLEMIGRFVNAARANNGLPPVAITETTVLTNGDIELDSLDLGAIVMDLQDASGLDPFAGTFTDFRTAGDLVVLFSDTA